MSEFNWQWTVTNLRDAFAGQALQGLLAGRLHGFNKGDRRDAYTCDAEEWAKMAYAYADAMLAERERAK